MRRSDPIAKTTVRRAGKGEPSQQPGRPTVHMRLAQQKSEERSSPLNHASLDYSRRVPPQAQAVDFAELRRRRRFRGVFRNEILGSAISVELARVGTTRRIIRASSLSELSYQAVGILLAKSLGCVAAPISAGNLAVAVERNRTKPA